MDNIIGILEGIGKSFQNSLVSSVLTVLVLFFAFYYSIRIMARNNAKWLIAIFTAYILVTGVAFISFGFTAEQRKIYFIVPAIFILALTAMFATEIKRDIWDLGIKKNAETKHVDRSVTDPNATKCIDEIIKALQNMSKNDVGALVILASGNLPKAVTDSGVAVNSDISSALIESIFFPKTPLHDGAMVINGTKIEAAGCFLPLAQEVNIPKELGSRHRAGIGITETINVTALIVSEETGIISIAQGGKIKRYADSEMLKQTLKEYYWQEFLGPKNVKE
ncbi:MAG: diadenylate cyclase [Clostridia bacterium]|nr:diadenylate cyclase [Clostridia bacterium]